MIITRIKGGLGNQMFQYALGRKLALQNKDVLKLDISDLGKVSATDSSRPYGLRAFGIEATEATREESQRLRYPHGKLSWCVEKFASKILRQHHMGFEPAILEKSGNLYLNGYWQSPQYFEEIRDTLLRDFVLVQPLSQEAQQFANMIDGQSVSIHIRRGDYVSNTKVQRMYGSCSLAYYKKAVEHVQNQVPNARWFVFSDDIDWVKANLPLPESAAFVKGKAITDAEELILMSKCAHNIIANSSFSWWGAWLNQNPEKIIIAPTPWFDYKPSFTDTILPASWIRLPKN